MFDQLRYDERIWRQIGDTVELRVAAFLTKVQRDIASDRSLDGLPSKQQIIWQRADDWLHGVYVICCDVYKDSGNEISAELDHVIWAFCMEPLILQDRDRAVCIGRLRLAAVLAGAPDIGAADTIPSLLELLLCAIGSPQEKRRSLRVRDKQSCLRIRSHLHEAWQKKLLHLTTPTQVEASVSAVSRYNAVEAQAMRTVADRASAPASVGAKPAPAQPPTPPLENAATSLASNPLETSGVSAAGTHQDEHDAPPGALPAKQSEGVRAAAWEDIEIRFLSDERVQIMVSAKTETRNYDEFGFSDGRTGNPNQAWILLRTLAEHRGIIRDAKEAGQAWPKVEKRIQEIRMIFRAHFKNSSDPILFVEGTGYQACFKISCAPSYRT